VEQRPDPADLAREIMDADRLSEPVEKKLRLQWNVPFGVPPYVPLWFAGVFALLALIVLVDGGWNYMQHRASDRRVCEQLQGLDGTRDDPLVLRAIHQAGQDSGTRLGSIVRSAGGDGGHLDLVSEDYDYVSTRCADVGRPALFVDPAAGPQPR